MASSKLTFAGKTAIITGAGGALGRSYALDLAKRGCNLLINDVFAALNGAAQADSSSAGEKLVWEIQKLGGKASYNGNSVAEGEKIVESALKAFGRCDILINNAGNLRDKSFSKMTLEDWESVLNVHLNGTFKLCHSAWPAMQSQNFGRIINIGSGAGLYGNFGQANYSSAKMGILGLTNTLAKEGEKYNITANCIVPVAGSRMTETVLSQDMLKMLHADHVTPIVTYLVHETTNLSGNCFEVGGGWYSQVRLQRSAGRYVASEDGTPATAEAIQENIRSIRDFSESTFPTSAADAFRSLMVAKDKKANPESTNVSEPSKKEESTEKVHYAPSPSDEVFEALNKFLGGSSADALVKLRSKIVMKVKVDDKVTKHWYINTRDANPAVAKLIEPSEIEGLTPNVILGCDEKTIMKLAAGNLSPEFAYMRGSLQIDGQMGAALKLKTILELARKSIAK